MMRRTVRVHQWSVLLAIAGCAGESSDAEFRSLEEVDIGVDTDDSFGGSGSGSMTGGSFSTSVGSSMSGFSGGDSSGGDDSSTSGGGSFSTSVGSSFSTSVGSSLTSDDGSTSDGGSTDDGSDGGDTGSDECTTDDDCPLPDDPCRLSACGDDGYCFDYHDTWGCGPEEEVCEGEEECADEYSDPECPAAKQPAAPAAPGNGCAPGDDVDGGPGREDTEVVRYSRGNNDGPELLRQWAQSGMPGKGPQHYVYKTGDITVTTTLERSGCTCMGGMVGGTMEVKTKFEIVNLPVRWQDIMLGAAGNARGWMMFPGAAPTRATRPRLRDYNGYGGMFVNRWWPRVRTYKHNVNVPARKQFQVDNRGTAMDRTDDIIWDEVTNEVGCGTGEFITRFSMAPRARSGTNNVDTGLQAYIDVKITTAKNGANVFVSDGESHYLEYGPGYDWTHGGTTDDARKEIAEVEYVTGVAMGNETALTNWLIARETHRDGVAKNPGGSYPNRL